MAKGDELTKKTPPSSPAPSKTASVKEVVVNKTNIAMRLQEAVRAAKPVNRSSDLVPLSHDYDQMRKALTTLIGHAKHYHAAVLGMDKARMDMVIHFSSMSTKTPIFEPIGSTVGVESFATVAQAASKETQLKAAKYKEKVLDYCVEWERVVTTRVDKELKETKALHDKLNHYQNKIENLRKKVNTLEGKSKAVPKNLTEKVTRNEEKLDHAWRAHEKCASKLCNLLDEITKRGWKDLYPLVKSSMNWEVEHACGEYDVMARLPPLAEDLTEMFEKTVSEGSEGGTNVPVVLADEASIGSDTTGPYEDEENTEGSSAGAVANEDDEEYQVPPTSPSHRKSSRKVTLPTSPTGVSHV